jgi:hypothetical protein
MNLKSVAWLIQGNANTDTNHFSNVPEEENNMHIRDACTTLGTVCCEYMHIPFDDSPLPIEWEHDKLNPLIFSCLNIGNFTRDSKRIPYGCTAFIKRCLDQGTDFNVFYNSDFDANVWPTKRPDILKRNRHT